MKIMLIGVLAVITAASTLSAQDTIRFESYRTVDVCSNERRWLLAVNLGKVLPSDSLVSFDITIGYDRTLLRPTDVLKEGTLSSGMAYEPFLNTVVPNEMRIAGGNIIKTVYGDLPLVAVAGEFLGSCSQFDTLGYPWPSTFNAEFKKKITVARRDTVKAIATAKSNKNAGIQSDDDSVVIDGTSNAVNLLLKGSLLQGDSTRYRFHVKSTAPQLRIASDKPMKGLVNVSEKQVKDGIEIDATVVDPSPDFQVRYDVSEQTRPSTAIITIASEVLRDCACEKPTLRDTVQIKIDPTVSVTSSDEHIENLYVHNDVLVIQCDHEEMKTVQMFTLQGVLVMKTTITGANNTLSLSSLAKGGYVVRTTCGEHQHGKLILK
jgi:hypothetical protein